VDRRRVTPHIKAASSSAAPSSSSGRQRTGATEANPRVSVSKLLPIHSKWRLPWKQKMRKKVETKKTPKET
jgi:hypothetical protein